MWDPKQTFPLFTNILVTARKVTNISRNWLARSLSSYSVWSGNTTSVASLLLGPESSLILGTLRGERTCMEEAGVGGHAPWTWRKGLLQRHVPRVCRPSPHPGTCSHRLVLSPRAKSSQEAGNSSAIASPLPASFFSIVLPAIWLTFISPTLFLALLLWKKASSVGTEVFYCFGHSPVPQNQDYHLTFY